MYPWAHAYLRRRGVCMGHGGPTSQWPRLWPWLWPAVGHWPWRLALLAQAYGCGACAAHLRLRKYAKCSVETLYLSETVGAVASSTSVSGTRVSIMTSATSEAVAVAGRVEAAPRSAIVANAARGTELYFGVVTIVPSTYCSFALYSSTALLSIAAPRAAAVTHQT